MSFDKFSASFSALKMDLRETIRLLINQRLSVVAEEIFAVVERVIVDLEKEDSFLKLKIEDQRRIVELVMNADTGLYSSLHCS